MKLSIPKEQYPAESRVILTPEVASKLIKLGAEIEIEKNLGQDLYLDSEYQQSGAVIQPNREILLSQADIVLRIRKPSLEEISKLKKGCAHISFLDPFNEEALIESFSKYGISAVSLEMIPRTTLAQKMDVLSSQANLAGYVAVMLAAGRFEKVFPLMMTPAGTLSPAKVLVIGAGVAGLQAIATAKRLGARVEAFDTRPVVEEQVHSLGAKFLKIELGETGQTQQGYAKELTREQLEKQQDAMAKFCSQADIIITTAQVFGKKAPRLITNAMIKGMKRGSVIVDLAVESGGNVEGSELGKETVVHGVYILGYENLAGRVSLHASQMLASNLYHFLETFWNKEKKEFVLDRSHEIIQGCLITHEFQIVNETLKALVKMNT